MNEVLQFEDYILITLMCLASFGPFAAQFSYILWCQNRIGAFMATFEDWKDIIEELDCGSFTLSNKEIDFIESLLEKQPKFLTNRQEEWLEDLKRKYLC